MLDSLSTHYQNWQPFLTKELVFGQSSEKIILIILFFLVLLVFFKFFRKYVLTFLHKTSRHTETKLDDQMLDIIEDISPWLDRFLALYITWRVFDLSENVGNWLDNILIIIVVFEVIKFIQVFIRYALDKGVGHCNETTLNGAMLVSKIVLWAVGILLILSNLGYDVSTLAASLGIGGIAIALAAQNILSDLFASFSIYFDKPFEVGDYIVLGDQGGVVHKIGLKTTRIKTLQGEELVVSNQDLTATRVQNYQKLENRRYNFTIGVEYGTPSSKLRQIPEIIQKLIEDQGEIVTFGRAHFVSFNDSSLDFDIMYYVNSADYEEFLCVRESINFAIKDELEKLGVGMAFPTRTIWMNKT